MIKLTFYQLLRIGVHLGHSYKNSKFFSSWMLYGFRNNMFIINVLYSLFFFKSLIDVIHTVVHLCQPIWFVNFNKNISDFMVRYVFLCGESFSIYKWVGGVLTNFENVILRGNFLINLISQNKYKLTHHELKTLYNLSGFKFNRNCVPGLGIFFDLKTSYKALHEFNVSLIPTISIVDSDTLSFDVSFPIPGNDDSLKCINFYMYFFSRLILLYKINLFRRWKRLSRNISSKQKQLKHLYLLYFLYEKKEINYMKFQKDLKFNLKKINVGKSPEFLNIIENSLLIKWKKK